jgi:ABC-type Fe3+/spermidine/putrescine transport system ATPase subunit
MNAGQIEQIGTPAEVYESPATVFVADFLGVSNLIDGEAVGWGSGECTVAIGDFKLRAACGEVGTRGAVKVVARPERVHLLSHGSGTENCLPGMVERTIYVGATLQVMVRLVTGVALQVSVASSGGAQEHGQGTPVDVHVPPDALRVLGGERANEPAPLDPQAAEPAHAI